MSTVTSHTVEQGNLCPMAIIGGTYFHFKGFWKIFNLFQNYLPASLGQINGNFWRFTIQTTCYSTIHYIISHYWYSALLALLYYFGMKSSPFWYIHVSWRTLIFKLTRHLPAHQPLLLAVEILFGMHNRLKLSWPPLFKMLPCSAIVIH